MAENKVYLIVEDDGFKERQIAGLIHMIDPTIEIERAHSVNSCLRSLESGSRIDLILLDMSLPNYDVGATESGGTPQGFGGRTVLYAMEAQGIKIPVIVVTQFEQFRDGEDILDLAMLRDELHHEFGDTFKGLVFYSGSGEKWRQELTRAIDDVA